MNKNTQKIILVGTTVVAGSIAAGATALVKYLGKKRQQKLITIEEKKVLPMTHQTLEELSTLSDETIKLMDGVVPETLRTVTAEINNVLERFVTTPTVELNNNFISFIFKGPEKQYYLTFYDNNYTLTIDGIANSYRSQFYPYEHVGIDGETIVDQVNKYINANEPKGTTE